MENLVKNQLETELKRNVTQQTKLTEEISIIKDVQNNLKSLAEQPERPHSFFQVNSLAYVPATIIHTGEQYVALGNVGQILMTTQETLSFLQRKIDSLNTLLDLFKHENTQLQKRQEMYFMESNETSEDVTDMPAEITSDFGTAYKTGTGVFEIIEPYREDDKKPVRNYKKAEDVSETVKNSDWYMKRLEELEQEENDTVKSSGEDETILNKVKVIIKECGLYESLSKDLDVKRFCDVATKETTSNGESFLNSIIIKALLSESTNILKYSDNDLAKNFRENVNVSENDLRACAYLDSIEDDL